MHHHAGKSLGSSLHRRQSGSDSESNGRVEDLRMKHQDTAQLKEMKRKKPRKAPAAPPVRSQRQKMETLMIGGSLTVLALAGMFLLVRLMDTENYVRYGKSVVKAFNPLEVPPKQRKLNATWQWDVITVAMPIDRAADHSVAAHLRASMDEVKVKKVVADIRQLRAPVDVYVLDEVPDPDPVVKALLPDRNSYEQAFKQKRPVVFPMLRHMRAWEIGFAANNSHFVVLDGEMDMEAAKFWDGSLSELIAQAERDIPGWDILALNQVRLETPAAWECGLRFASVEDSFEAVETFDFKAYVVAANNRTQAWFKPFVEWRHRRMGTERFVEGRFYGPVREVFYRKFRAYQTTYPLLECTTAPGYQAQDTNHEVRGFWRRRASRPCKTRPRPRRDQRHLGPDDPAFLSQPCQHHWHGNLPGDPVPAASRGCGELWDVPALYVNLDEAKKRRERMESGKEGLGALAAPMERSAAVNKSSAVVRRLREHADVRTATNEVEVAVLLAHLAALDRGARQFAGTSRHFVVLEDDIDFGLIPHWDVRLSDYIALATAEAPDWEILNLAPSNWHFFPAWDQCRMTVVPYDTNYQWNGNEVPLFFGLVCYAVRIGPGLDKLLAPYRRFMEGSLPPREFARGMLREPADWMIYKRLKAYVATSPLLSVALLRSQIKPGREHNHKKSAEEVRAYWQSRPQQCTLRASQPASDGRAAAA